MVSHIASLAPTAQQCQEVGQLAELLIFLVHTADAIKLQRLLSEVLVRQKEAEDRAGEGAASVAAVPAPKAVDWKWDILRPVHS